MIIYIAIELIFFVSMLLDEDDSEDETESEEEEEAAEAEAKKE